MAYRCVVLDIDGTILDSRGRLSARTRAAVGALKLQGILVLLATGRTLGQTLPAAAALSLSTPLVVHNGALIYDPTAAVVLRRQGIPIPLAGEIISALAAGGTAPGIYLGNDENDPLLMEQNTPVDVLTLMGEVTGSQLRLVSRLQFDVEPLTIAALGRQNQLGRQITQWQRRFAARSQMMVFYSGDGVYAGIEFTARGVHKASAVAWILERYGLDFAEVMAIGDDINDRELLQQAGLGIAMGSGDPRLQEAVSALTASNDEDGAAQAIEKYILRDEVIGNG